MSKEKTKRRIKISRSRAAIRISKSDVKTFLEGFQSDVAKKREGYQLYRKKLRKKEE